MTITPCSSHSSFSPSSRFSLDEIREAASAIYQAMPATPQYHWPLLSQRLNTAVWVKHENHTPLGAFKIRGGLVYVQRLLERQPAITTLVCATRGNHGQSVAFAAQRYNLKAVVVVPIGNCPDKNRAMAALGAQLIEHGEDFQASIDYAKTLETQAGWHFVPSFHPDLVLGVATGSLEFLLNTPVLDTVYVAIGQGSGLCAMIEARNALKLPTRIIGVVSENAPAYALSFAQGQIVSTSTAHTFADGVACRCPNPEAFAWMQNQVERVIAVPDTLIAQAMRVYFTDTHQLSEGAGAAALAGLMLEQSKRARKSENQAVGVVLSGGNIELERYTQLLQGNLPEF